VERIQIKGQPSSKEDNHKDVRKGWVIKKSYSEEL
jgi:hypothetical protein